MRMLSSILLIAASLLLGCGHYALPGPTTKGVVKADLVGTWEYPTDDLGIVKITLSQDGTFVQSVQQKKASEIQIHKGQWDLDGTAPKLVVLKPVFGDPSKPWILEQVNWWVVDSHQEGVDFAIFGAADDRDPDSCWEFRKTSK